MRMASSDRPNYPQSSYSQSRSSSSVFYENEVKKDSEIMLREAEVQHLLHQNREQQRLNQQQYQQKFQQQQEQHLREQQQQQQQELLQQPVKSEPVPRSPERMAPVSSSISEISQSLLGSPSSSSEDRNRLSQSDKAHMCMTCFKGFRNKPQLHQHELVHTNLRKHVCSYCEKSFKQICHLNQHIRVHTGERPYKCDVEECGRSFAQLSNLNHHKKNHEEHVRRDVSRQFRCEVCERSYATKNSLNTHIQKLHSNLNLDDPSSIPPTMTTTPRKRKKKEKQEDNSSVKVNDTCSFLMECDSDDDDGLPTQVKVKPRFGPKSNLTVRIGTPPGNGEKDKSRQTPRTTLPLPFTTSQSQSSPLSLRYQQSQGQDNFITTFSDSVSQGQGHREMMQSQHPQNLYSHLDSLSEQSHSNRSLHDNTKLLHALSTNIKHNDGQTDELKLMEELSKNEAIIAEHRKQMQAAMSQREALLNSNPIKSNFGDIGLQNQQALSSMSKVHRITTDRMAPTDHLPMYGGQSGPVSRASIQSDLPSHIAHHYPKTNNSDQTRNGSQHIFNPAFMEQGHSVNQNRYDQNQY